MVPLLFHKNKNHQARKQRLLQKTNVWAISTDNLQQTKGDKDSFYKRKSAENN